MRLGFGRRTRRRGRGVGDRGVVSARLRLIEAAQVDITVDSLGYEDALDRAPVMSVYASSLVVYERFVGVGDAEWRLNDSCIASQDARYAMRPFVSDGVFESFNCLHL